MTPTVALAEKAYSVVGPDATNPGRVTVWPVGSGNPVEADTLDDVLMYAGPVPVHEIATVFIPGGTVPIGSADPDSTTGAEMTSAIRPCPPRR